MLEQIERELATPPSSEVDWSRDGIDADVEERRQHILDNFPDADELMVLLGRVFREAPVGGILFRDFDNKCRVGVSCLCDSPDLVQGVYNVLVF